MTNSLPSAKHQMLGKTDNQCVQYAQTVGQALISAQGNLKFVYFTLIETLYTLIIVGRN